MGKTKAGNVNLATAGLYPKRFYNLFTDAHNGDLSSYIQPWDSKLMTQLICRKSKKQQNDFLVMGQVGNAERNYCPKLHRFVQSIRMWRGTFLSVYMPVLQYCHYWFRLLDRIVLIHMPNQSTMTHDVSHSTLWNQCFSRIISHVWSAVENIVQIGQWLHTSDGRSLLGVSAYKKGSVWIFGQAQHVGWVLELHFVSSKEGIGEFYYYIAWNMFLCACTHTIHAYITYMRIYAQYDLVIHTCACADVCVYACIHLCIFVRMYDIVSPCISLYSMYNLYLRWVSWQLWWKMMK
jgi:hypothetical protein